MTTQTNSEGAIQKGTLKGAGSNYFSRVKAGDIG